jgi:hypothetical protein
MREALCDPESRVLFNPASTSIADTWVALPTLLRRNRYRLDQTRVIVFDALDSLAYRLTGQHIIWSAGIGLSRDFG